jgi:NADH-quinone oxidoreductase subunit H
MKNVAQLIASDPGWLTVVKGALVFALCVLATLITILMERKVVAWMQMRVGPNRTGWRGSLQSLADGVKLALKEDLIPKAADRVVFVIAPVISVTTCFMAFAVIPMSGRVKLFGHETVMQLTDIPVGVLYVLAAASVGVYGIVLAGWSSGSTYPLLGGLRSSAQVISYEVAMGLSLVAVFIYSGSMSTSDIVNAQNKWWFAVTLFPSFVIYTISMVGETNRAPFDLAEAEGELVGGFHTEYSSLKFALFFLAEYVNMVAVSSLATTMFLGGYHAFPGLGFTENWLGGWFTMIWYLLKVSLFLYLYIWLRGTLPRMRYDQFMKFGWKVLIPVSLFWIMVVSTLRILSAQHSSKAVVIAFSVGVVLVVFAAGQLYESTKARHAREDLLGEVAQPSFPVPQVKKSGE